MRQGHVRPWRIGLRNVVALMVETIFLIHNNITSLDQLKVKHGCARRKIEIPEYHLKTYTKPKNQSLKLSFSFIY